MGLMAALLFAGICCQAQQTARKPNVIIIYADDLGYGDLGVFGHPTIQTPNLDRMAFEGQKWTSFYSAAPVCTPSRAALMTGRLPIRSGMASEKRRVLFPDSRGGLPGSEITIARQLKGLGYATGMVGKWHLGHLPAFLPDAHGFDYFFGIPYSNDMDRVASAGPQAVRKPKPSYFNVPLMRGGEIVERPADQRVLTKRLTEEALGFIRSNRERPFFLYLAHPMPHVPLFASPGFEGSSPRGIYGDVVSEVDWSVGQVLEALEEYGIDEHTLVIFSSDNGPWSLFEEQGGSAGLLKGGKGGTYEGGMRVPAIFWWPGRIRPGVVSDMGSTLDLFPTLTSIAGGQLPSGRIYDGYDLSETLFSGKDSPRDVMFFYRDTEVYAVRKGAFKVHFVTQPEYGSQDKTIHRPPLVYNVSVDPGEKYNISPGNERIINEARALLEDHRATLTPVTNQLELR